MTSNEKKLKFKTMGKCEDCNIELKLSKPQESSGSSSYPECPKCGKLYGFLYTI